jgi:hypothetical protein
VKVGSHSALSIVKMHAVECRALDCERFSKPVSFSSHEIMPMAKIDSRATYHNAFRTWWNADISVIFLPAILFKKFGFLGTIAGP